MGINNTNRQSWKSDTMKSVSLFNEWFFNFAPKVFNETRVKTSADVIEAFKEINYLRNLNGVFLLRHPECIEVLRMCTCPPIARDRLAGLSGVSRIFVTSVERNPDVFSMKPHDIKVLTAFEKITRTILKIIDRELFPWLEEKREPTDEEAKHAMLVVSDRLCSSQSDSIIRNAQEARQLKIIKDFLESRGYMNFTGKAKYDSMQPGTFVFRSNVPGRLADNQEKEVNIPIDVLILRKTDKAGSLPLLVECKSAGDFANVNKRRKEEAAKVQQLKLAHGEDISFLLFLCGYFDSTYLGYESAEGIDWIWEHRIEDFEKCGI